MTKRSISANAIYLLLGQFANRVLVFAFYVVLARLQGDVFTGEYAIATTYVGFVFILVTFGIEKIVLREISRQPGILDQMLTVAFRSQMLVWIVTLPFVLATVFFLDYGEQTVHTIWLLMLWVPAAALNLTVNAVYQGIERMDISSMLGVVSALQLLLLGTVVLFLGGGLLGIAAVMIWERLSTALLGVALIRRYRSLKQQCSLPKNIRTLDLLRSSLPFVGMGLLAILYQRVDVLIMPMFVSVSDIGQYATAYRILEATLLLPAMISSAAFPVMARTVRNAFSRYQEVGGKSLQYSLMSAGLVIGILFVLARPIIEVIFGPQFSSAADLVQILVWGLAFQSINNTLGRCMIAADLERFFVPLGTLALISNVLLNLYLLPRVGVVGAAIATLGSYAFSTSMHVFIVWKHGVMPDYRMSLLTIPPFIIAGVITQSLLWLGTGYLSVVLGVLIYIVGLFSFRVVSLEQVYYLCTRLLSRSS